MEKPSFREALAFWVQLGFISFGGPAGQIAIMHEYLVEKKKWISDSRFLHALNYCMILPGPEAQQLATYTGWLLHGRLGGLAAGILFVLPSMFILWTLSTIYVVYGQLPAVAAMFNGLKPAVIAIVMLALIKIGKKSLLTPLHYGFALLAFISIFFFHVPFPLIILATLGIGLAIQRIRPALTEIPDNASVAGHSIQEASFYIHSGATFPHTVFRKKKLFRTVLLGLICWALPFLLILLFVEDKTFWNQLSLFFTQAALVTFGGAYAVLPYVAQVSVEKLGWLTNLQMIDGLALGETTPGPLVMVLAFVGYMAGYHHYGYSLLMGTAGLVTTTFFTFLPCFLFIFAGAPLIEKTQGNIRIKAVLGFVTAGVVGVILNLTIYLGQEVFFPSGLNLEGLNWQNLDKLSVAWMILSIIALHRFKVNMIGWIGLSAVFGLVAFLIQ
jgi:chromate transporter